MILTFMKISFQWKKIEKQMISLPEGLHLGNDADEISQKLDQMSSNIRLKSKGFYMQEAYNVYISTKYSQMTL